MIKYTEINNKGVVISNTEAEDTEGAATAVFNAMDNSHYLLASPSVDKRLFVETLLHPLNWEQRYWGYEANEGCNTYSITHDNGTFRYMGRQYRSFDAAAKAVHKRRLRNLSKMIKLI